MIIESIQIKNFRSILDQVLFCESLTALVGANGAGKSSFLRGLDLFYNPSQQIDSEDFYNGDTTTEIIVAVTFKNLSEESKKLFSNYIQGEKLTVERVFAWDGGKVSWKYHGAALQNREFQIIRDELAVKDRDRSAKEAYEKTKALQKFSSLPAWSNLGAVQENLKQWEADYPNECTWQRDEGQFFGFKEVAQGYLGKFTRLLFIPAVREK